MSNSSIWPVNRTLSDRHINILRILVIYIYIYIYIYALKHNENISYINIMRIYNTYIYIYIERERERVTHTYKNTFRILVIYIAVRVFANGPGDLGSIPGRVIPKTQKMVLDASLLNTQHYKVRIKGKVEQSRERSRALPTRWCSKLSKREPSGHPRLWSLTLLTLLIPSHKHNENIYYIYIYIYIYIYTYIYINIENFCYIYIYIYTHTHVYTQ